ncbi:glycosyltransferase family 2 protein [Gemmobacter sp.]|uniref:glycosyltransferase family 2 protein n=1 Tax=Gemmobacter sp. TaxID=1898957 RepID=UPI002AFF986C|nr:glycosyltransferase [Gemmobacter sp.]
MHIQTGRFIADQPAGHDRRSSEDRMADHLLSCHALRPAELRHARAVADRLHLPLAEALAGEGLVPPRDLAGATARLSGLPLTDPLSDPPDPRLVDRLGARRCLTLGLVPLRHVGGEVLVALARPAEWPRHAAEVTAALGPVRLSHAPLAAIQQAISAASGLHLRLEAESRVPVAISARSWRGLAGWQGPAALVLLAAVLAAAPLVVMGLLLGWLVLSLAATTALRATALGLALRRPGPALPQAQPLRLPVISILLPLYGEPGIAPRLLQRLGRLDYPRALLDVLIVLEAKDTETRAALAACHLPGWMRVVIVPDGPITTKPRAMNYALDFCRGSIIGIYDAEDAPDPDQLRKVVQRFADRGPEVVCLQGCLDYYNPRTNLLARLFTTEYASWFRVVMPALEHLRLPMPLGGTTLFMRREALERVGAWDAHNVTEDADLGVRLARHGLRTEMLPTTTHEEANCRLRPWVRQRSRWIKGHILTWAIHMRDPVGLWRDLGWRGFLGYQVVFLGAQSQVLLAPVMWTFWAILAGLPHPVQALLPQGGIWGLVGLFLLSEALVMATGAVGLARTRHGRMWPVVPLLHLYHPLGAIAGWRALWEAFRNPFYWAKTSHGHFDQIAGDAMPGPTTDLPQEAPGPPIAARPRRSPFHDARAAPADTPATETAAARTARTLGQEMRLAPLPGAQPSLPPRVRTSPASIFRRVSNAREIWVRSAS